MPKIIHIEDVKLKSMSVEIKALTVSGKQMTLSVFRQIPERRIWDDNLSMLGVPWGKVIYFWGDEKDCNGFQVVWQDNDVIYRSIHWKPVNEWAKCNRRDMLVRHSRELEAELLRPLGLIDLSKFDLAGFEWDRNQAIQTNEERKNGYEKKKKLLKEITEEINTQDRYNADAFSKWEKAYKNLEALPQLFIAL